MGTRGRRGSGIPRRPRPQTRRWLAAAGGWRRARGPVPPFRRGPAHRWVCPEAGARARARTWEDRKGGAAGAVAAAARIARGRSAAGAESAVCVRSRALSHGRDEHGAVAGELPVRLLAERHGGAHLRLLHHHRLQRPERPGAAARLADHAVSAEAQRRAARRAGAGTPRRGLPVALGPEADVRATLASSVPAPTLRRRFPGLLLNFHCECCSGRRLRLLPVPQTPPPRPRLANEGAPQQRAAPAPAARRDVPVLRSLQAGGVLGGPVKPDVLARWDGVFFI